MSSFGWMNHDVVKCQCLFPNDHPTAEIRGTVLEIPLSDETVGPALKEECSQTGGTLTWYIMADDPGGGQSPRVDTERGAPLPINVRPYAEAKASVTIKKVQELDPNPPDASATPETDATNTQAATDSAADDTGDAVKQASEKAAAADAAVEAARNKVAEVRAGATGEDEVEAAAARTNYLTKNPEKLQNFNDQCFLLEYAPKLLAALNPGAKIEFEQFGPPTRSLLYLPCTREGKYGPQDRTCYDTNIKYISHITMPPGAALKNFFEITPDQTAQIVPFIEISINIFDNEGKLINSIALDFDNKTDLETAAFKSRGERNLAGIKNITINLDGIDTATSRLVTVNASFVFQDFRTIFRPRKDVREGEGRMVRRHYSDLFSYDVRTRDAEGAYKKLNFKIGWAAASTLASDAKLGLAQQMLRLDVQIVKYTFDFQMDGSVIANIIYKGLLETALDGPESNVLSLVKETMSDMNAHRRQALQEATETRRQRAITSIREDTLRNLGTLLYKEKLLSALSKFPGGKPGFDVQMSPATSADAPLYIKNAKTREEQLGEGGRLIWVPAMGDQSIGLGLGTAALQGQLTSLPGDINVDANEMSIIVNQVKRLWTGRWSTSAKGMTKDEFDKYLSELNNDNLHEDVLARKNKRTIEKNLLKAHIYAQEALLQQQAAVKFQGLWQLARSLLSKQHIYYVKLSARQKFKLNENLYDQGAITKVFSELNPVDIVKPSRTTANAQYVTEQELNEGYVQLIPFVFLGDFLKVLLELPVDLSKSTTVLELIKKVFNEDFKVDLGYIYYSSPFSGGANDNFPLYYLPLSLVKLNNFFTRNIVGKELTFYSFRNFVQDILQEFLVVAHQNCRSTGQSARVTLPRLDFIFGQTLETRHHFISKQSYQERWGVTEATYTKMFKTPRQHSIWFIYGAQSSFNEIPGKENGAKAFGSYLYNVKNNIFHFYLGGQNKGIIKSVKLIDNTNPDLKTAIYLKTQSGNATNLDGKSMGILPPLVYKVEIETLGCALFHMGNLVFLDARQFIETNIDRVFKISGYYRIYKVTHNSGRDGFTTTVTAILEESYDEFKNRAKSGKSGIDASGTVSGPSTGGAATILGPESAINEDLETTIDALSKRMQKFKRNGDAHGPGVDTQLQGWVDMIKTGKYPCVKTVTAGIQHVGSAAMGTTTVDLTKEVAGECTATFAKMAQTTVALSNQSHARATLSYDALKESWNIWKQYDCEAARSNNESDVHCERNRKDYLVATVNALGTLMEKHGMRKDWTGKPTEFLTLLEKQWKRDIMFWKLGDGLEGTLDANREKVKLALSNLIAAQKELKEAEKGAKAAKEELATKQKEAADKEGAALQAKCADNHLDEACLGVYTDENGAYFPGGVPVE